MMTDEASDVSISAIRDGIAQTQALLMSLDTAVEGYTERKSKLDQDLGQLEMMLDNKQAEEQTRQYQQDLKFLDDSGAGSLPENVTIPTSGQYGRPYSSYSSPPLPRDSGGFSAYAGVENGFGRHFVSDGMLPMQNESIATPSWDFGDLGNKSNGVSDPSLFQRADVEQSSGGSASSPDQGSSVPSPSLPAPSTLSKKRPRDSLSLPALSTGHAAKAMRTTPSPAMTGTTTPSSMESFDIPENADLFRLIGGNPKDHLREMREDQKVQEKMIQDRREQERRDAELARQMQEEADAASGQHYQSWAMPNTLPRTTSQTFFDAQRRHPLTAPLLSSSPPPPKEELPLPFSWPHGQTKSSHHLSTPARIKSDGSRLPPNVSSLPKDDFVDLGSGDEYDEGPGDASSDLVEINPRSWRESSRDIRSERKLPWIHKYDPTNGSIQINSRGGVGQDLALAGIPMVDAKAHNAPLNPYGNPYQAGMGYGGSSVYNSTASSDNPQTWTNAAGQFGQTVSNAAKGAFNTAYSLIDQQIASYPSLNTTYGDPYNYGSAGTSGNPQVIPDIDLDCYGQPQQSLAYNALNGHSINADDPKNRELVDRYLDRVNYLTNDPTRTSAEIKSLLENIRPDEDLPAENREGTPDAMTYPLMEHQKLGLAWMKSMEEGSNKGGILADDMGLGKTIQALALMVSRRSSDPTRKSTLIVAPVALMKQWEREIQQKLKPGRENKLTSFILHGANRQTTWEQLRKYDVVLTTFGTLANEVKRKEGIDMAKRANPNWRPTAKGDQLPLLGDECKWFRVIVDEAQCIKNKNTKAALGAASLQALTRFCMSGTPMMNNVGELYSLIHFLRIKPYNSLDKFNRDFTKPLKQSNEHEKNKAMQKLQALLKAILLRRTKKSKIDGAPILTLPERTTIAQHAVFSDDEHAFYRALESQTQLQFNKYLKAGTVGRNYSNVLVLLLRLRQACCHPHLIKDFGMSSGGTDVSMKDMLTLAKELTADVVARIMEQGGSNEESALECPVCMDMAENATIFIPCGHSTCSECFARISDPSQAIAGGDADGRNAEIKCPSCRGKVIPTKIIDHNAFKKVHMPELAGVDSLDAEVESTDDCDSESDDNDASDGSDNSEDLKDFIVPDEETTDKAEPASDDESGEEGYRQGKTPFEKSAKSKPKEKAKKGKGKAKENKPPRKTLAQLKKEGARNVKSRRQYLRRLEKEWETSGKIEKVMEILQATQDRKEGEKTIIFSQFTSLLDLLEIPISRKLWGYKRYDGSMSSNARNEAVIEFSDNPRCKVMLVSLKAGNSGLNLVAASQVIIFDPFWNPYIEEQAIDRAHRIGQMRPVQVHRILVPETVEDRILALQEKKRELIEGALDEKASQSIGRLGTRELAFLFVSTSAGVV